MDVSGVLGWIGVGCSPSKRGEQEQENKRNLLHGVPRFCLWGSTGHSAIDFKHKSLPHTRSTRLRCLYAAFFAARIFAHLARSAAAIFLREDADIMRFGGAELVVFATAAAGCDCFRTLAHRAF